MSFATLWCMESLPTHHQTTRLSRVEAQTLLRSWSASEISLAAFARQAGVHPKTLYRWRDRLSASGGEVPVLRRVVVTEPDALRVQEPATFRCEITDIATLDLPMTALEPTLAQLLRWVSCSILLQDIVGDRKVVIRVRRHHVLALMMTGLST